MTAVYFSFIDNSGIVLVTCASVLEIEMGIFGSYDLSSILYQKRRMLCRDVFCDCFYQCCF